MCDVVLVLELLLKRFGEKCPKIVRVYSEHIHHQDFPIPRDYSSSRKRSTYEGLKKSDLRRVALHYLIRDPKNQPAFAKQIQELDEKFRRTKAEKISDAEIARYKDLIKQASIAELKKYDVILCCCSVSASPRIYR